MNEIIPIYQAALLLEEMGCDLQKSEKRCLTPWAVQLRESALAGLRAKVSNLYSQSQNSSHQREFWIENLRNVSSTPGLFFKDKKRRFNQNDRVKAWLKQNGICPICKKPVQLSDIGHHSVQHSNGGMTDAENCVLLHQKCHDKVHEKKSSGQRELPL